MNIFDINSIKDKNVNLPCLTNVNETLNSIDHKFDYNAYDISGLQLHNPIYNRIFNSGDTIEDISGISLKHEFHLYSNDQVISRTTNDITKAPIHIKYSPILDPLRYMVGKYKENMNDLSSLPKLSTKNSGITKINDPDNSAYTDCFFNYLVYFLFTKHNFVHGLNFFGNYIGIQSKYKMNITDDVDYLNESIFFNENVNKLFDVTVEQDKLSTNSRCNKNKLRFSDSLKHNLSVYSLPDNSIDNIIELDADMNMVYDKKTIPLNTTVSSDSSDDSDDSALNYSSDEEELSVDSKNSDEYFPEDEDATISTNEDTSCSEYSNSDDEDEQYAYIHNFPVNLICLEKCDGTFDDLLESESLSDKEANSALFQIIMILITYQKAFHFTHNDLHTNNIMYSATNERFITYKYNNEYFKVPTFGRIYKIIDFGRSIYRFNNQTYCSDSFSKTGDASTQYNCEPFFDENKPRIDPNQSFDLCRLGCSIYDFIIEDDNDTSSFNDFQQIVYEWCLDDNNKNILYKRNGEERYPQFKLYKMIARNVHNHKPTEQLNKPYFSHYKTTDSDNNITDIDSILCYI
jgi:hypothetical protein